MSRQGILIGILILAICIFAGVWFVKNNELVEIETSWNYSGEAKHNPYFAARLFLRNMGYDANVLDISELKQELPDIHDTLIITTERHALRQPGSEAILNWVGKGGYLIVRSGTLSYIDDVEYKNDSLLDLVDIQAVFDSTIAWPDEPEAYEFPSTPDDIIIEFNTYTTLDGELIDDTILFDANGTHMIHRQYQEGALTVFSSMDFLDNDNIGEYDHARALVELIKLHTSNNGKVWILHDEDMPSLLSLFWKNAFPLVIIALLMLVLWLTGLFFRFGPLLPQPVAERRQLLEHIDASGQYFWKNNQQKRLTESVQSALKKRIAQIYPGWEQTDTGEKQRRLGEILQLPDHILKTLFQSDIDHNPQDFTRLIRQLDNARKQL